MYTSNIIHLIQKIYRSCASNISGTQPVEMAAQYPIMKLIGNKGCGVALLNKLRHSPCLEIILVIFCNNSCQVLL